MKSPAARNRVIRVIVADDEPPARRLLRRHLERHADVEVIGEATNGAEAVAGIRTLDPDLVFLDVQMPELDGFQVVREVGAQDMPPVVFVTAYDSHAIHAFDVAALDYLLKPIEAERFDAMLARARTQLDRSAEPDLARLLESVRQRDALTDEVGRIPVRIGERIRLVPQDEIDFVSADGNYVRIHAGRESYLLRESLTVMERKLASPPFVRVHRSTIVNVGHVTELEPLFKGEYVLRMRNGERLTTGRSFREPVRRAFGLSVGDRSVGL